MLPRTHCRVLGLSARTPFQRVKDSLTVMIATMRYRKDGFSTGTDPADVALTASLLKTKCHFTYCLLSKDV